jgi:hypothetical protein
LLYRSSDGDLIDSLRGRRTLSSFQF